MDLSIVTVSMNRTEHLAQSASRISVSDIHREHVILDWGSTPPVSLDELPRDSRIKLFRVPGVSSWWLTHAYNLAISLTSGDFILKVDADVLLTDPVFLELRRRFESSHLFCERLTLQDWQLDSGRVVFNTNGLFAASRQCIDHVNGFNPYIQGWGCDDVDLYSRVFRAGFSIQRFPCTGVSEIDHDNLMRTGPSFSLQPINVLGLGKFYPSLTKVLKALDEKNKRIALQSLYNNIRWPTLYEYKVHFNELGSPPIIKRQAIFSAHEFRQLVHKLFDSLLPLNRYTRRCYNLIQACGLGPSYGQKKTYLQSTDIISNLAYLD